MPDIFHEFPVRASADKVFEAISSPSGLDSWWTLRSSGQPVQGSEYELKFGDGFEWRAVVSRVERNKEFELTVNEADDDWRNTRLTFQLEQKGAITEVMFQHTGWAEANKHYNVSCFCWAMYLRLLRRYIEFGEVVPYEQRLEV